MLAPAHCEAMNTARRVALPAYLISATLIAAPLVDVATSLYPWNVGDARWRFGAIGVFTNASALPLGGLLVMLVIAIAADHRVFRRVLTVGGIALGIVGALLLVLFALDALQTRSAVRPEMRLSFTVATATAAAKLLLASITCVCVGLAARRFSGEAAEKEKRPVPEPILWSAENRAPARK